MPNTDITMQRIDGCREASAVSSAYQADSAAPYDANSQYLRSLIRREARRKEVQKMERLRWAFSQD